MTIQKEKEEHKKRTKVRNQSYNTQKQKGGKKTCPNPNPKPRSKPLLVVLNKPNKKRRRNLERTLTLEKASPKIMIHSKMDEAWAFYKAIATLYLQNAHKIDKGGPLMPLTDHTILIHQFFEMFVWYCK